MAVGPANIPDIFPVEGIRVGTTCAGIRKPGRKDLVVFEIAEGASVAATSTQNRFCAAPVLLARQHLEQASPRYWVINTGYANAGTGALGMTHAKTVCQTLADLTDVPMESVLPFSTGVIGEYLPVEAITAALPACLAALSEQAWLDAAEGIMTTDTRPKIASRQVFLGGKSVNITGISKGAGMICPNMATMLAFIATDAEIAPGALNALHKQLVQQTFNRITIDSDTSTNDMAMIAATGRSGVTIGAGEKAVFEAALLDIYQELAHAIVKDGEGATKFVEVKVEQGASESDCLQVAYTVAHSPLVKTALFASDPNWGRILAAVGRAPIAELPIHQVSIWLNDVLVVSGGGVSSEYTESAGQQVMNQDTITIRIALGAGQSHASVWTSDLSHEYVSINADYRS